MAENNHVPAPDMIQSVLQEIGLDYVAGKFKEEKVDVGVVNSGRDEDLKKLGVRIIGQLVRVREICRSYYDTTNNNTHGCGSYSYNYTTTTRLNTTSSMQTIKREETSLFSSGSSCNNGHHYMPI